MKTEKRRIGDITLGPNHSRQKEPEVFTLMESIRYYDLLHPPLIGADNVLISGFRRYKAMLALYGPDHVWDFRVTTKNASDVDAKVTNLIENLSRLDLNLWDEIQALSVFGEEPNQVFIAEVLGKSRSWVRTRVLARTLPEEVQAKIRDGKLTASQVQHLLSRDPATRKSPLSKARPSVKELEESLTRLVEANKKAEAAGVMLALGLKTLEEVLGEPLENMGDPA